MIQCNLRTLPANDLRIIVQQFDAAGNPYAHGAVHRQTKKMDELIRIIVKQDDKEISLKKEYDKMIWSGLSWGVAEVKQQAFDHTKPLVITCRH